MRFALALFMVLLLCSIVVGQEEAVNPALILKECTEAKATCKQTEQTCTDSIDLVNNVMSWTGIKILIGVGLIILATWFTIFTVGVIYRWIYDIKQKTTRARYVDQLEHTNALLLDTINRLNENLNNLDIENQKLQESKSILRELLDVHLPEAPKDDITEEVREGHKRTTLVRVIGLIVIILGIIGMIIVFWKLGYITNIPFL